MGFKRQVVKAIVQPEMSATQIALITAQRQPVIRVTSPIPGRGSWTDLHCCAGTH